MNANLIYYYPLLLSELYLILTLLLFEFGAFEFKLQSPGLFWALIFLYHIAFIAGYIVSISIDKKKDDNRGVSDFKINYVKWIYFLIFLALLSNFITTSQVDIWKLFINPYEFFGNLIISIANPGDAYSDKIELSLQNDSGNKLLNILLFFTSFSKLIIIPFLVICWAHFSLKIKVFGIAVSFIPMLNSILNGQNKGVFDFFIVYSTSFILVIAYAKCNSKSFNFNNYKKIIIIAILAFVGFVAFFGSAMSQRGGDLRYIEFTNPSGNITVKYESVLLSQESFLYYTYAWLTSYVVQGYFGFSLALEESFESTYGVGNSIFLTRNIDQLFNINLNEKTFQRKIDNQWSETAQWHSFYSYFANDLNFPGVSLVCFLIAFLLARVWRSFLVTGNVFAGSMLPILSIMIIFFPANNQIFGFLDGLSSFFWTLILWLYYNNKKSINTK